LTRTPSRVGSFQQPATLALPPAWILHLYLISFLSRRKKFAAG
jgi:hypothetical protein